MFTNLRILGDASTWTLADADAATLLHADAAGHAEPVVVPVVAPVPGRLILSVHALAAVGVFPVPPDGDWMPSYIHAPEASLYLPSTEGCLPNEPGYALTVGADLADLEEKLVAAMRERRRIQITLAGTPGSVLIVNGATLDLIALLPPVQARPAGTTPE